MSDIIKKLHQQFKYGLSIPVFVSYMKTSRLPQILFY